MSPSVAVGVIGCGTISTIYLQNCLRFPDLRVVACADLLPERAQAQAQRFGIRAVSVDELLADPAIELVINLTVPQAHGLVAQAALAAGKAVYNEKPLALTREEGRQLLALARERGLVLGCAPDTFLGAGLQTCRALIDAGAIGEPVAALAVMQGHGPESWHPSPHFYYQPGAGPLFDMGPYYLTALITMLGPIQQVAGMGRISFAERVITSQPHHGARIQVETPTHIAATLAFAAGPIATLVMSFDIWHDQHARLEIYGSEGTLQLPDPNTFGGPVRLFRPGHGWQELPVTRAHSENSRGIGVLDLAQSWRRGGVPRASGELAFHVLDVMHAILESAQQGRHLVLDSSVERPPVLPEDWTGTRALL